MLRVFRFSIDLLIYSLDLGYLSICLSGLSGRSGLSGLSVLQHPNMYIVYTIQTIYINASSTVTFNDEYTCIHSYL